MELLLFLVDTANGREEMAAAGHALMIFYGLRGEPSSDSATRWAELTWANINQGIGREAAGDRAAREIFTDYHTRRLAVRG